MQLRRAAAIVLRQYYLARGSVTRLVPMFLWVAIEIVLWGFITKYLNSVSSPGIDFVPALLGAVVFWNFFNRVMSGVTMAFFEDVWSRNFLNIFASPLQTSEYLLGLIASSIATSAIGLVGMLAIAIAAFGFSFAAYGAMTAVLMLVLFLFGIALGIVGCAIVLRLGPAAEWFVWPIPAVLSPFAGVFYPLATLPEWMQLIALLMPPAYVFEALRAIVAGTPPSFSDIAISLGLAVLYVLGASWIFVRVYRHAVRTGLIARYSAESVA
jgi:ABC-2 type transport system permease protein